MPSANLAQRGGRALLGLSRRPDLTDSTDMAGLFRSVRSAKLPLVQDPGPSRLGSGGPRRPLRGVSSRNPYVEYEDGPKHSWQTPRRVCLCERVSI